MKGDITMSNNYRNYAIHPRFSNSAEATSVLAELDKNFNSVIVQLATDRLTLVVAPVGRLTVPAEVINFLRKNGAMFPKGERVS